MTWMVIRLVLSLAFVAGVLLLATHLAKKRGLGQGSGLIEVVARQRMGRTSSVSVLRVAGRVLVVGTTDDTVTLLTEVEGEDLDAALAAQGGAALPGSAAEGPGLRAGLAARTGSGALAGSVLDRGTWTSAVQELRERTVRRS
ncbi:flagellar biosynthetic protein FliO [Modestobacter sp. I12A-02662]|uniref:flagellar biosynthetic protein FliO n=1 Tax=Modestobacter sp. I12A-02662 TaxID=1730496 RepID=UPI0034DFD1E1